MYEGAERRGTDRPDAVTAGMHFELSRRIDDIRGRVDLIHRLTTQWDNEIYNLRSDLSSALNYNNKMIQKMLDWAGAHDAKESRREWVHSALMILNVVTIIVGLFAILHK